MLLDSNRAEERLSSPNNLANKFQKAPVPGGKEGESSGPPTSTYSPSLVVIPKPSTGNPGYRVPNFLKTTIATLARAGETQQSLADEFGISQVEVHNIENGKTGGIDEKAVRNRLNEVKDISLERLSRAVMKIDDDKMENLDGLKLSSVARNLAQVVERIDREEKPKDSGPTVQVTIFAPRLRDESHFNVIEVKGE